MFWDDKQKRTCESRQEVRRPTGGSQETNLGVHLILPGHRNATCNVKEDWHK